MRIEKTAVSTAKNSLEYNRKERYTTVGDYVETEGSTGIWKVKEQPRPTHCQGSILLSHGSIPNFQLSSKFDHNNMKLGTAIMYQA